MVTQYIKAPSVHCMYNIGQCSNLTTTTSAIHTAGFLHWSSILLLLVPIINSNDWLWSALRKHPHAKRCHTVKRHTQSVSWWSVYIHTYIDRAVQKIKWHACTQQLWGGEDWNMHCICKQGSIRMHFNLCGCISHSLTHLTFSQTYVRTHVHTYVGMCTQSNQ